MKKVTAGEFKKQTGEYQEMAQREPLTITKHGRPSLVLLSFDEYQKLTGQPTRIMHVSELSDTDADTLRNIKMPSKYDHLNDLMED